MSLIGSQKEATLVVSAGHTRCRVPNPRIVQQFSPSDLSTIAQSLDDLERNVDEGRFGRASANMDDTGALVFSCRDSIS